jgi:hypothetical protein
VIRTTPLNAQLACLAYVDLTIEPSAITGGQYRVDAK